MKDIPIPFTAPMVREILAGRKRQTRRLLKWREPAPGLNLQFTGLKAVSLIPGWFNLEAPTRTSWDRRTAPTRCPYGEPGGRLWVREAWRTVAEADALPPRDLTPAHRVWFEADAPHQPGAGKLRPGMFMPRWASRITLPVLRVRAERLLQITHDDACAEGIPSTRGGAAACIERYRVIWEAINGPGSWELNPWVWVVEFDKPEVAHA